MFYVYAYRFFNIPYCHLLTKHHHIRYGSKINEKPYQPLSKYMSIAMHKYPGIRNIYLSTETESVINTLIREYPNYNFYYLSYNRTEYLDLEAENSVHAGTDYIKEFMYSLTSLYIAVDGAMGFIGSYTSSWCTMLNALQRYFIVVLLCFVVIYPSFIFLCLWLLGWRSSSRMVCNLVIYSRKQHHQHIDSS
jgi:hypothetical protein